MKAARLYGKNDLRVEDVPVPEIGDDEMRVRVRAATVCGTDLRMYANGATGVDEGHPLTLCHEFAGTIDKVGKDVKGYEVGERVSVAPNIGCGVCDACVSGGSHHCEELEAFGIHIDGAFAEFVKIPARAIVNGNVTPLPDGVSFEAGAANEAFACVYNSFERYGVNPGDVVLIIGAGAIGMMHAKLALMAGASKVLLNDLSEDRLRGCKAIDPRIIIVSEGLKEVVDRETNGRGADVVITACSVPAVQEAAFDYAGLNGRVNFFGGLPSGKDAKLDTNQIHYKQLQVSGTTRSSHEHYRKTLDFISKGLVDIDPLVTDRYSLEDVQKAFDSAAAQQGLKQAVVFD
ncbi:MAG: alcohol dehydrogenase catalytic domain-containing protein [Clostridiales Family XIII bacterium]|jgi:L-iditol 2-dehydrogenase|nr:alcohol dehydrogenase catalytic domain-containing protein [Clostridiales Family XIII bacterium]